MKKVFENWSKSLAIEGKSENTIDNYIADVQTLLNWIKEDKNLEEVTLDTIKSLQLSDLKNFMYYLMNEKHNSESTRARRTASIKNFYNYLCEENLIDDSENISIKLKSPKIPQRERIFLTEEKSQVFVNSVGTSHTKRNIAMLMTMFNGGLRVSEVESLNVDDINFNDPIKIMGKNVYKLRVIGKGNKERIVYLNEETIVSIKEYLKVRPSNRGNALFLSERKNKKTGYRITSCAIREVVKNIANKLDIKKCSPHTLRHSFATIALKNGVDLKTLQKILGHSKLDTTGIYAHCLDEQKQNVAIAIGLKANIS